MLSHPAFQFPLDKTDWIYGHIEYYSAMLIFLHAIGNEISPMHLEIIGDKKFAIPELNAEWLETLLYFYLFTEDAHFSGYEKHQEEITNILKRNGILHQKTISFLHSKNLNAALSNSLSKLKSIDHIVDIEHQNLGKNLRMVILTDYIRKEFLVNQKTNTLVINKIGVIPIFEQLRRTNQQNMKLGVLSGSIVIIPKTALQALQAAAHKQELAPISYTALPYDEQYLIINTSTGNKHLIVQLITQIFEQGHIEVLVGTKSLLGEGWDAPAINALILASFVGSFVLSNQMRGRAIRTSPNDTEKTSNIWHLVSIDPSMSNGGSDIDLLKRRFKSFVGVTNNDEVSIENGINRIGLPKRFSAKSIQQHNQTSITQAGQRTQLMQKWETALKNGVSLTEEIKIPYESGKDFETIKTLYKNRTVGNFMGFLGSGIVAFMQEILMALGKNVGHLHTVSSLLQYATFAGITGALIFGKQFYVALRLYLRHKDLSKKIHQIGIALLDTLIEMKTIQTKPEALKVVSSADENGAIYCHLEGGTTFEKSVFIKALEEISRAITNPRYLIVSKHSLFKQLSEKSYYAVPEIIGKRKKNAAYFKERWQTHVGGCKLIYTRTIEGRKILLSSRISTLTTIFEEKTERINRWR